MAGDTDGGFVIFSGSKLWYSSKDGLENTICKPKITRSHNKIRDSAKTKRNIEFQLFEDIKNLEKDQFWYSFFEDAAVGKFPRNFKFINGILIYKNKNKNTEIIVPETPLEAAAFVKAFVYENAGIISPIDIKEKKSIDDKHNSETAAIEIDSWKQVKNDKQQGILISIFIQEVSEIYNLNLEERTKLFQKIKLGLLSGYLNTTNIVMENGIISFIEGLEFDDINREFNINTSLCKIVKAPKKYNNSTNIDTTTTQLSGNDNTESSSLIKLWTKYINDINKKYK